MLRWRTQRYQWGLLQVLSTYTQMGVVVSRYWGFTLSAWWPNFIAGLPRSGGIGGFAHNCFPPHYSGERLKSFSLGPFLSPLLPKRTKEKDSFGGSCLSWHRWPEQLDLVTLWRLMTCIIKVNHYLRLFLLMGSEAVQSFVFKGVTCVRDISDPRGRVLSGILLCWRLSEKMDVRTCEEPLRLLSWHSLCAGRWSDALWELFNPSHNC